jgi:hypothetical protein
MLLLLAALQVLSRRRARRGQGEAGVTRPRGRRLAAALAAVAATALLVMSAAFLFQGWGRALGDYRLRSATLRAAQARWPALQGVPLPVPAPWLEGLDWVHHRERTGEGWGPIYLRGERRESGGFRGYYLWAWAYKVPLATQLLLLAAAVVAWRRRERHRWLRDEAFLLLPPLLFALHLNLFFAAQMGVRYSLMVFPPLYVFAGSLVMGERPLPRRVRGALGGALAWLLLSVLSWHPHYLSYFNELLRDRRLAWQLLADSNLDWGQNERYLRDWRAAHPEAVLEPPRPRTGLIVVRANFLTGVLGDDRFAWLRALRPVDHVGYSYLVFRVGPEDLPAPPPPPLPLLYCA